MAKVEDMTRAERSENHIKIGLENLREADRDSYVARKQWNATQALAHFAVAALLADK